VNYYRGARDIAERTKAFIKRGCRTWVTQLKVHL
jgi:hypothetical protein